MSNEIITVPQTIVAEKSDVLTSTSRAGDFVHQSQTMASEQGFRNVSKLWYDKTISFEQGREKMAQERLEREDIEFPADAVKFSADEKGIVCTIDDRDFRPTPYALSKLCSWYHTPSTIATYYLNPPNSGKYERDKDDYDVVCYALENGVRRVTDDKELLFRTYKDGTLRSVMSDGYSIVDNDWYLDLLSKLVPGGRLSHWRGDADTIYGNIIIPDTIRSESDSDYGGMISISNCEIGKRIIGQIPSIFRAICMNGCIWGQTKGIQLRKRHKGIILEDLANDVKDNIIRQIPLTTAHIDVQLTTKQWKLETQAIRVFAAVQQTSKFITPALTATIAEEYLNQGKISSAFGIIDAITRVSQYQEPELAFNMDVFAASILNRRTWDYVQHTAKGLSDEMVMKSLNVAV